MTATGVERPATGQGFGWRFTAPLLLGSTLNPINSSMLATGLAGIAADLRTGPGATATLVSVLYLCSAVAQPTMGKLATLFGSRRIFLIGVAILLAGGAIGGVAPNFATLLVSRALIGIGTSACYPTAMALVRRRGDQIGGVPSRVLGNFSIAAQITVVFGLPIGGVLTGAFGWRALFLINIPIAVITLLFAFFGVERDPVVRRGSGREMIAAIDLPGIVLFAGAILGLLLFLDDLTRPKWWLLAVAVVLTAVLIGWERRAWKPLIDVRVLGRNGPLMRTYLRQIITGLGIYTCLYSVTQWMERGAGYSAFQVGLIMLPLSVVGIVVARIASSKGWIRWPLILGGVALIASGLLMFGTDSGSGPIALIALSTLFGLSNGGTNFANQSTLYAQTAAADIATAAGLFRTCAYVGAIFSASVIAITFGAGVTDAGFHRLAAVVVGIGIVSLLLVALDRTIPGTASVSSHGA